MSKKTLTLIFVSLCLGCAVVAALELWAERTFTQVAFNPEARDKIKATHPDAIFIGNSVLSENMPKIEVDEGMNRLLNKKARVFFIHKGGMHTAWHYLVLKNQIVASGIKKIPVFILDYEDFFVRPEAKTSTAGKSEQLLRQNLDGEDPVFLEKIGAKGIYFTSGFPYLYSHRYNIKRWVTAHFVRSFMRLTGTSKTITSRRWRADDETAVAWLLSIVFKGANFRSGQGVDDMQTSDRPALTGTSDEDFRAMVERSFLPEILKFKDRYKLIFVQSSSNPNMTVMKESLKTYTARLERYLNENGAYYIDLNRSPELQQPELMHDSRHFTKGAPRSLNVQTLMKEVEKQDLLREYRKN